MITLFRQLEQLRPNLAPKAGEFGFNADYTEEHNVNYFALEFLEQLYVRHFLAVLSSNVELESVVLVHDGIYLAPQISTSDVAAASAAAAQATGMPTLLFTSQNLTLLWNRTFGHLDRLVNTQSRACERSRTTPDQEITDTTSAVSRASRLLHFNPETKKIGT